MLTFQQAGDLKTEFFEIEVPVNAKSVLLSYYLFFFFFIFKMFAQIPGGLSTLSSAVSVEDWLRTCHKVYNEFLETDTTITRVFLRPVMELSLATKNRIPYALFKLDKKFSQSLTQGSNGEWLVK